jgi:hypothetical protein
LICQPTLGIFKNVVPADETFQILENFCDSFSDGLVLVSDDEELHCCIQLWDDFLQMLEKKS